MKFTRYFQQIYGHAHTKMQQASGKNRLGLVWFLCLMAYQLFLGYLMPKPFS